MRSHRSMVGLALALAFAGCEQSNFGGSNAKPGSDKDANAACSDGGEATVAVGESVSAEEAANCSIDGPKKFESENTDIATVGPDGKIVGKTPGETDVIVEYEDGTKVKVHVTVTDDTGKGGVDSTDGNGNGGLGGDGDGSGGDGGLGEDGDGVNGCQVDGDKIKWKWPKKIQKCFDDKKLWDFTREECTTIPEASSFDCDWDGINSAVKGIDANFTPDWDEDRLKLISCGEKESSSGGGTKKTVVWQYVMLPKKVENGKCDLGFGAGIAIGCFSETKLSLTQSNDPSDLQACLDD